MPSISNDDLRNLRAREQRAEIARLLAKIAGRADAWAEDAAKPTGWGAVGSLAHVAEELRILAGEEG